MSEEKPVIETPISDNTHDFIREFIDDAERALDCLVDDDYIDTYTAVDAEKNSKIKEYLFV